MELMMVLAGMMSMMIASLFLQRASYNKVQVQVLK